MQSAVPSNSNRADSSGSTDRSEAGGVLLAPVRRNAPWRRGFVSGPSQPNERVGHYFGGHSDVEMLRFTDLFNAPPSLTRVGGGLPVGVRKEKVRTGHPIPAVRAWDPLL